MYVKGKTPTEVASRKYNNNYANSVGSSAALFHEESKNDHKPQLQENAF